MMMRYKRMCISAGILISIATLMGLLFAPPGNNSVTFLENPCIKPHEQYSYLTCHPVEVMINNDYYVIPDNFDTDLASIPRWFWMFLSPNYSGFIAPSILHDYLYTCPGTLNRDEIDEIFYDALVQNGISKATAYRMYIAVRIFGESNFKSRICQDPVLHIKYIGALDDEFE